MKGCPACEATWPAWKKVKKTMRTPVLEIEAQKVPAGKNVTSFPTFVLEDENGLEVKRVEGRQLNAKALMKELGVKPRNSRTTRRRRVRARTTRRQIR